MINTNELTKNNKENSNKNEKVKYLRKDFNYSIAENIADRDKIFKILTDAKYETVFDEESKIAKFKREKNANDFNNAEELLVYIKDNLNYRVHNSPALSLILGIEYSYIITMGKKYGFDLEELPRKEETPDIVFRNDDALLYQKGKYPEFYKAYKMERIPVLKGEEKKLEFEHFPSINPLGTYKLPVMKDEFTGAKYVIIDFYNTHKFYDYIKAGLADSIKSILIKIGQIQAVVSFIVRHKNNIIHNGYLEESKILLSNAEKKYIVVPKEIIGNKYQFINDKEQARFILNKLYNEDGFIAPSKEYDSDEQAYQEIGRDRLNSVEVVPVLINNENNKIIF